MKKTTGDQQLVKRINRSVLLRLLRHHSGLSRAQLAQESGLTKSTVSQLVRELIDEGWIAETGIAAAKGLGRPSTPLRIDGSRRAMIGAPQLQSLVRAGMDEGVVDDQVAALRQRREQYRVRDVAAGEEQRR